ncbi:hypothetical protein [Nocardioides taihuensis]|uniref:Uncharacterized protein n=1 Tax=Nocardioides taihuensis TaxID=1835606 RepID=A0ABW0BEN3_9ACTN
MIWMFTWVEALLWATVLAVLTSVLAMAAVKVLTGATSARRTVAGLGGMLLVALVWVGGLVWPVQATGTSPYVDGTVTVQCDPTALHAAVGAQGPSVDACQTQGRVRVTMTLGLGGAGLAGIVWWARRPRSKMDANQQSVASNV